MTDERNPGKIDRRQAAAGLFALPLLFFARRASGQLAQPGMPGGMFGPEVPERPTFFFAQLSYGPGLAWNPYPTAARSLMETLVSRTSVAASPDRVDVRAADPKLFTLPFLYWTGSREFPPLAAAEIERLRLYLESGGFMLVDDALSAPGVGFDKSFQRELSRLFPGKPLVRLPDDHTVFISYYLIDRVAGRTANRPYLAGINLSDRTPLIYSSNDLGGAWARDRAGKWLNQVEPGGELQRETAIRIGINVILYSLCLDYKKDLIHTPFISERRRGKKP